MGNNNYFDDLIASYLSKNLDRDEEAFVQDWINSSEQNKQYFEELKNTWNLLLVKQGVKNIDVNVEWDQFKQVISTKETELCIPIIPDKVVNDKVGPGVKGKLYKLFISTAVAASLLLVIALVWRLMHDNSTLKKQLANRTNKEIQAPASFVEHQINTTDKTRKLLLKDGSEVILFGRSEVIYNNPFTGNRRDIKLVGKAYFKVAKDKLKPFTVFTGDISTTALGTQFTITALPHAQKILVRLHEGKVVVKSNKVVGKHQMKDMYLIPGQELVYNVLKRTANIRFLERSIRLNKKAYNLFHDNPLIPTYGETPWFMFNNQPLNEIFDALANMYNVKIDYFKRDLNKMYFIGTFDKSDSILHILNQITLINNLLVIKDTTNTYTIKKQVLTQKN